MQLLAPLSLACRSQHHKLAFSQWHCCVKNLGAFADIFTAMGPIHPPIHTPTPSAPHPALTLTLPGEDVLQH